MSTLKQQYSPKLVRLADGCHFCYVRYGLDVTKRAIIDVNSIVSGRNYDIVTLIIAQLPTSRPFGEVTSEIPQP